jgi:hypothetical protein
MNFQNDNEQLNTEWITISALSEAIRIAVKGDKRSTYEQILKLSKELYPQLFNINNSLLLQEQESDIAIEYRQKAEAKRIIEQDKSIKAIDIITDDIKQLKVYIRVSESKDNENQTDKLKRKLISLEKAQIELDEEAYTENDILLRDVYDVDRMSLLKMDGGKKFRDFKISDNRILRIRLLHPDKPEHITGADIIYEHHNVKENKIRLSAIQYKLWSKKQLSYDERMMKQIDKLSNLFCNTICNCSNDNEYRFPTCSAFLRPTDKIQKANQRLLSTGEHIPICKIDSLWEEGRVYRGEPSKPKLTYNGIKKVSVSGKVFEQLFKEGKIGSKEFDAYEIEDFYKNNNIFNLRERVIIHAQEIEIR